MEEKVLVAFSSKHGATAEIAERVGQTLRGSGLKVDVLPVDMVRDLTPYRAFVVGTAAYMFRWRSDAVLFLKKRQNLLAQRPTWLFSSGPLGKGDPVELLKGQRFPKSLQPIIDRIKPRDVAVFHGFVNMQKLNLFEKFVFNRQPAMQGDFRDWDAIISWANTIAADLKKSGAR